MEEMLKLAATFLAHASVCVVVPEDTLELGRLLHRTWETGRSAWPRVDLPADVFVRHLARRLPESGAGSPLAPLLEQVALADLYLACACVRGVPAAIETLEREYLEKLPATLAYLKQPGTVLDEVRQLVRIHLLIGTNEAGPRLVEYTGRGTLPSWIRVIATRMAHKQVAPPQEQPEENLLAALEDLPSPGPDAELALIKRRHHREFRQATREAFSVLSTEQRHLLRLHFIDRLSTTEMAPLFRVSQSTVSRWLKVARQAVFEETRRCLQRRLGLSSHEFSSLLASLDSQFDLSLSQVLEEQD
jgi:RNA polymerase sigma-70 factor, ECF subfamily